jgi:membrane protease subunit (stomatin/prohibitin family)
MVWDAEKSVLEVENFETAVSLSAQTGLRDAIGRHELGEMLSNRDRLGREIQQVLDAKTNAWGITVQSVEIRDIIIPKELEDAMSRQAQAERERQSRIILSQAEMEIAASFETASEHYRNNPVAFHLRAMNMVFEGLKKKGSMIIVPSTAVETMGLGAMGGLTAFDRILGSGDGPDDMVEVPEEQADDEK